MHGKDSHSKLTYTAKVVCECDRDSHYNIVCTDWVVYVGKTITADLRALSLSHVINSKSPTTSTLQGRKRQSRKIMQEQQRKKLSIFWRVKDKIMK